MSAPTTMVAVTLAHQGGWDEILLVLLPIAIFAWLLSVANRRASRQLGSQGAEPASLDAGDVGDAADVDERSDGTDDRSGPGRDEPTTGP